MTNRRDPPLTSRREMLHVAIPLYPGCTLIDVAGPHEVLAASRDIQVTLWATNAGPVVTEQGVRLWAERAFQDAAPVADILLVPGTGRALPEALGDAQLIGWIAETGRHAAWVASVCTGALLLGAAGLLTGYRATAHWTLRGELARFGARPEPGRVVRDRNRLTGGGATAGIDLGLMLLAALRGEQVARAVQLGLEYAPEPPFAAGTPERAGPALTAAVRAGFPLAAARRAIALAASRIGQEGTPA